MISFLVDGFAKLFLINPGRVNTSSVSVPMVRALVHRLSLAPAIRKDRGRRALFQTRTQSDFHWCACSIPSQGSSRVPLLSPDFPRPFVQLAFWRLHFLRWKNLATRSVADWDLARSLVVFYEKKAYYLKEIFLTHLVVFGVGIEPDPIRRPQSQSFSGRQYSLLLLLAY